MDLKVEKYDQFVGVHFSKDQKSRIEEFAKKNETTVSKVIRTATTLFMNGYESNETLQASEKTE